MTLNRSLMMLLLLVALVATGCQDEQMVQKPSAPEATAEQPAVEPTEPTVTPPAPEGTAAADSDKKGMLKVEKTILDFGLIEPGSRNSGSWTLHNAGDALLKFGKPGASCGCTKPVLGKKELAPGERTELSVVYNAGTHPGKVVKKVWVNVLPPGEPAKMTLPIHGEIRKQIAYVPESYEFQLRDVATNTQPLVLTSTGGEEFAITAVTSTNNAVSAMFDTDAKGPEHTLSLALDMEKLRDTPRGAITIKTTHPKAKQVVVNFKLLPPFTAEPPKRYFRDITPGEEKVTDVTIISNYDVDFELGEITSERGLIDVMETSAVDGGQKIKVAFKAPSDTRARLIKDKLIVNVKDRPADKFEVLFYGRVKVSK